MNFEEYLSKLKKNISDLERSDISLSDGIALFEEGIKNTKQCLDILNESKGRITVLKEEMDELLLEEEA